MKSLATIFLALAVIICISCYSVESYKIGVGRADVTGPPVEVTFMGYANLVQKGRGLHLRQFSRAFVVEDLSGNRVAYVSVDSAMMGYGLKREVIKRLKDRYQDTYTMDNVIVSGTHTHSGPGGFLMDLLYDLSILGFVPQTYDALAQGIYLSIKRATDNLQEGKIFLAKTTVLNANINRSPTSYLMNPEAERARYEFDVDKDLTQLKFVNLNNELIGVFQWFAVHPTSMNNTNRLVSSDNVGYASMLLEKHYNPNKLAGKGKFVGAFASTNLGDVSPNIKGPKCQKSGNPCDVLTSRCPKGEGECVASGPGKDMFESTHIIATRLYEAAVGLLQEDSGREVTGDISFIHQTVNMTNYSASVYNPLSRKMDKIRGCLPMMGYSFAAGTTDGPGVFLFEQGETTSNPMWNALRDFIAPPTQSDIDCQHPKPILLATGRAIFPFEWQPKVVPTQLAKIGDLIIAGVPGEPTTMSGRRLRNAIRKSALESGGGECDVILAGLSNLYSSYITTFEEFQAQRYEAASTLYGPHTLSIYINQFKMLTAAMMTGKSVDKGPEPPYLNDKVLSLVPGVIFDGHPIGKDFGSVKFDAKKSYGINDVASVTFISGNPRNNIFHEKTYLVVERKINERWKVVHTDADWDTKMHWERTSALLGFSDIRIEWTISPDTIPGEYRIRHFGNYKYILGGIFPYEGVSRTFNVTNNTKF